MVRVHLAWRLSVQLPVRSRLIVEQPAIWVEWTRNRSANTVSGVSLLSAQSHLRLTRRAVIASRSLYRLTPLVRHHLVASVKSG